MSGGLPVSAASSRRAVQPCQVLCLVLAETATLSPWTGVCRFLWKDFSRLDTSRIGWVSIVPNYHRHESLLQPVLGDVNRIVVCEELAAAGATGNITTTEADLEKLANKIVVQLSRR